MLMDESSRFVTGLDLGTENVRAVIASVTKNGEVTIVGYKGSSKFVVTLELFSSTSAFMSSTNFLRISLLINAI